MSGATTEVKRVGYAVAIGVNVLLLVGVNNSLAWGWFPWLTPEFGDVLPILNLALVFNIVVSVLLMFYDESQVEDGQDITEGKYDDLMNFETSSIYDDRQKAALAYTEAIV